MDSCSISFILRLRSSTEELVEEVNLQLAGTTAKGKLSGSQEVLLIED